MAQKFVIDPSDVTVGGFGMSGGRKKVRYSRASQVSSREMVLIHRPTGVQVRGEVTAGNCSRKEMKRLTDELYQELFILLQDVVAKKLRTPGRQS